MSRLPWPRPSIRVRLTVWYGAMFLLAGVALLGVTYLLVDHALSGPQAPRRGVVVNRLPVGERLTPEEASALERNVVKRQVDFQQRTLDQLLVQGGIALGGLGVIAVGMGWLTADRVLRPLHQITDTARRVADSHLHERIALAGPDDELKELANTFDAMLDRLERAFVAQRKFVGNASHELRTPLAINRTLLEVAMSRPGACADLRQLGGTLLAVNARHERLIDGLLTLARSEHEPTEHHPVDLAEIAAHTVELTGPEAEQAQVRVRTRLGTAITSGDPVLLERLVENLLHNAIRHNHPDGWVELRTALAGDAAELVVTNTGPTVPGYEVEELFQPFRRGDDRVRSDRGVGLGLSIVRAVAHAHGGSVTATPRPGGGLVVRARLPHHTA